MKIFDALACLFPACLVGELFMTLGIGRWYEWPASHTLLFIFIVACSFPFWLFTFVPFYLIADSRSSFWRWYIAPLVGATFGFIVELILFAPTQYEFYDFPRQYLSPLVIGFTTFLFGAILKHLSARDTSTSGIQSDRA